MVLDHGEPNNISSRDVAIFLYLERPHFLAVRIEQMHFGGKIRVGTKERAGPRYNRLHPWLECSFDFVNFDTAKFLLLHQTVIILVPLAEKLLRGQASEEHFVRGR